MTRLTSICDVCHQVFTYTILLGIETFPSPLKRIGSWEMCHSCESSITIRSDVKRTPELSR